MEYRNINGEPYVLVPVNKYEEMEFKANKIDRMLAVHGEVND